MRAYRLTAPGQAGIAEVEVPAPGTGEVLLRVLAAGVCRTDLSLVRAPAGTIDVPVTLGHEIVGEVVECGRGADSPPVGATVAVYELLGCGTCSACRRGADNVCREVAPGAPGITRDGGMAEHVVVPARNLVDAGGLDPLQAAPLTDAGMTALHAVRRGLPALSPDGAAVVTGIGGLGHLALQFLAALSPARVVAVDVDPVKLEFARQLGAADVVPSGEGAADAVLAANGGRPVDVAFDFVGAQPTLDLAARVVGRGGAIVVTGGAGGRLTFTATMGTSGAPAREVTVVHTFGGTREDLVEALRLAAEGRVHSHVEAFALEHAGDALAALDAGRVLGRAVVVP